MSKIDERKVEEIRKAGCKAYLYADGSNFHEQRYRSVAEPRITIICRQPRGRAKVEGGRATKTFVVDDAARFDSLEAAVAAIESEADGEGIPNDD